MEPPPLTKIPGSAPVKDVSVMNYYTSIKFEYCNVAERHTLKPATACMYIRN